MFKEGVEEERTLASLTRCIASVLEILESANPNAFSDPYIVDLLRRLSDKIKNVLDEIE
jgi:hypothetical protein